MSLRTLALLTLCLSFTVASADWNVLCEDSRCSEMQVKVLSCCNDEVKLEVTVPGYHLTCTTVEGKDCCVVRIPGANYSEVKGFPLLPMLGTLVKVNNLCNTKLEVVSKEVVEVDLKHPIIPSKGHLTRDINPETVACEFGPIYNDNVFYVDEKNQITMGSEFIMHSVRGVRLQVMPVSVNHVTMKMKFLKKAVVSVKCEGISTNNVMEVGRDAGTPAVMDEVFANSFINHTKAEASVRSEVRAPRLIAVVPSQFESLLGNWVSARSAKYNVTVKTVGSESANDIKAYLQKEFDSNKFEYVVLFGDVDTMPTLKGKFESASADRCYVRLAGNDNYPDAFISRISGNADQITTQLNKILNYEKGLAAGNWNTGCVTIASAEGSPSDTQRAKWLVNGGDGSGEKLPVVSGGLKKLGYTFAENYGSSASASKVASAVNAGSGVICYIGHGSATSWVTSGFNVTNVNSLNNGEMLPVIWSVACVNGQFTTGTCFAEAWLRKANGGAVAMEAASTNEAWDPPVTKQAATINAYILNNTNKTFGALEAVGMMAGMKHWGDGDKGQGNQLTEQCNLFGDCSMEVRYPTAVEGETPSSNQ